MEECKHKNRKVMDWPDGSFVEVCNDCGMSRNLWEQGQSDWILIEDIEKERQQVQKAIDSIPQMVCPACEKVVVKPGPCCSCQKEFDEYNRAITKLERDGHHYHCACRMVWGDGICECLNVFWHTTTGEELPI